jgi:hypothetical protein
MASAPSENSVSSSSSSDEAERELRILFRRWDEDKDDYHSLHSMYSSVRTMVDGPPNILEYLDLRLQLLVNSIPEDEIKEMWLPDWDEIKDNLSELEEVIDWWRTRSRSHHQVVDRIVRICEARIRELSYGPT